MRARFIVPLTGVAVLAAFLTVAPRAQPVSGPERFTVPSDGHPMAVWARRPEAPKGSILLVHGRTWSSRSM